LEIHSGDSEKEIDIATPLQVQVQHFWHSTEAMVMGWLERV